MIVALLEFALHAKKILNEGNFFTNQVELPLGHRSVRVGSWCVAVKTGCTIKGGLVPPNMLVPSNI